MTTFEDRERAFEAKYAHDEEFRFLVTARRDKLFAQWAAEQLHFDSGAKVELTAKMLAVRDGAGHDDRLLAEMQQVFREHGGPAELPTMTSALERCGAEAREQLLRNPVRA